MAQWIIEQGTKITFASTGREKTPMNLYILRDGKKLGPYTQVEIEEGLAEGRFIESDRVCLEDSETAYPLGELIRPEEKAKLPQPPAPAPAMDESPAAAGQADGVPNLPPVPPLSSQPILSPLPKGTRIRVEVPKKKTPAVSSRPAVPVADTEEEEVDLEDDESPESSRPEAGSQRRHLMLAALLVSVVLIFYLFYPYYCLRYLHNAIVRGDAAQTVKWVDWPVALGSLNKEISRQATIQSVKEPEADPTVTNAFTPGDLAAAFVQHLRKSELLGMLKTAGLESVSTRGKSNIFTADSEKTSGPITMEIHSYQAREFKAGFFSGIQTFRAALEDLTFSGILTTAQEADTPIEFKASLPQLNLHLDFENWTWRLKQVEIPSPVATLLLRPKAITQSELAGLWKSEAGREWELDVEWGNDALPQGGSLRMVGGDALRVYDVRNLRLLRTRLEFAWGGGGSASGRGVLEKQKGLFLLAITPANGPTDTSVMNREKRPPLQAKDLPGLWKCENGRLADLDFPQFEGSQIQGATLKYADVNQMQTCAISNLQFSGYKASFDWQAGDHNGTATLLRLADGSLGLYYQDQETTDPFICGMQKAADPVPPLTADELAGQWETDLHSWLDIRVSGGQFASGQFRYRTAPNSLPGELRNFNLRLTRLECEWRYQTASSQAVVEKRRDGNLWLLWEPIRPIGSPVANTLVDASVAPRTNASPVVQRGLRATPRAAAPAATAKWYLMRRYAPKAEKTENGS